MLNLFSDGARRNPWPLYDEFRRTSPLLHEPRSGLWLVFDYENVKRVLHDHDAFSSRHGPAEWMVFLDPPRHTKLRALISQGFTPKSVADLEPRIRELAGELLDRRLEHGEMDMAADFAVPLPMMVIAEMLGIPVSDRDQFQRWNDIILNMSYTVPSGRAGTSEAVQAVKEFGQITIEMGGYLAELLARRRAEPKNDLLTRLVQAEVDGERLTHQEILGFFQLLLLAGSETTTNLLNNAVLCFSEWPQQLASLQSRPELLPACIEEVLRFRSPLQWIFRLTRKDVQMHGQTIPAGKVVLAMIGSANRDPKQFVNAGQFDIARDPNPHIAFGHGLHFCLGAALARLEARAALTEFFSRVGDFRPATNEPWEPRKGLHVHGPTSLPIRFVPGDRSDAQRRGSAVAPAAIGK
jgi:cytochrome P450